MQKQKHVEESAGDEPAVSLEKQPLVAVKKDYVGVFMQHWKHAVRYGHNCHESTITSYRAGQLILDMKKVDELIALGAPVRVYSHDVQPTTSGVNVCPKG